MHILGDFDVIQEKIRKFKERSRLDANFAAFLSRESDDLKSVEANPSTSKFFESHISDPLQTTSGPPGMSNKQLEREVYLEALKCEQERYKALIENSRLEQEKLRRENDLMDLQIQCVQADLELKKQMLQEKRSF